MFRLRIFIIVVICWLFAILNFDRIIDHTSINITIQPFVYGLIIGMMVLLFTYPPIISMSASFRIALLLALYSIGKAVFFDRTSNVTILLASMMVDVIILLSGYWLLSNLARWFYTFDMTLKGSIFSPINNLAESTYRDAAIIEQRIASARRFGRELTLFSIRFEDEMGSKHNLAWKTHYDIREITFQMRLAELLQFLAGPAYVSSWYQGRLLICIPSNAESEYVKNMPSQIYEVMRNVLKLNVSVGVASFPRNGIVFDDLVKFANKMSVDSAPVDEKSQGQIIKFKQPQPQMVDLHSNSA